MLVKLMKNKKIVVYEFSNNFALIFRKWKMVLSNLTLGILNKFLFAISNKFIRGFFAIFLHCIIQLFKNTGFFVGWNSSLSKNWILQFTEFQLILQMIALGINYINELLEIGNKNYALQIFLHSNRQCQIATVIRHLLSGPRHPILHS